MSGNGRQTEPQAVIERYARRGGSGRYSYLAPEVHLAAQERQRRLIGLLKTHLPDSELASLKLLEIGCGTGDSILEMLRLGFEPANLVGVELIPARAARARERLPERVAVLHGDAMSVPADADGKFDIVLQSLVFSSLLANDFQETLARRIWSLLRPGGAVLWYDFIYNNPVNPDVRGVPVKRVRQLFPEAMLSFRRVTLAPPISRLVCRVHPGAYALLNVLPFLRTHVLCWLAKSR